MVYMLQVQNWASEVLVETCWCGILMWDSIHRIQLFAGKMLMFKYRLNAKKISGPSCGSSGACLDCMLWGIRSGIFFVRSSRFSYMYLTPCIHRL